MPGTDALDAPADPASVAATLREASFVRLLAGADGDAIAAAGILANALRTIGTPFQLRTTDDPDGVLADGLRSSEPEDRTVVLGHDSAIADACVPGPTATWGSSGSGRPASSGAYRAALELGDDPDPVLALAGATAVGIVPGEDGTDPMFERANERELLRRRPGVGLPTRDVAEGLAHSTLFVAPFSGDPGETAATLEEWGFPPEPGAEIDVKEGKQLASLLAIEVAAAPDAVSHAATAIETALRPYEIDGPFATLAGYADVLGVLACKRPGTAIALALDRGSENGANDGSSDGSDGGSGDGSDESDQSSSIRETALEAWRDHARAAHRAIRSARTGRYDGSLLARVDGGVDPAVLPTVARLLCDYRSPETVVVVVREDDGTGADAAAAAASREPAGLAEGFSGAAAEFDGTGFGTTTRARARFDGDPTAFAAAVRERL